MIVVSVDIHWYRGYPECTAGGTVYMKGRYASPGHWRPTKHKVCKKEQGPQPPPTTHVALATLVASNSNGSRMAFVMPHIYIYIFFLTTQKCQVVPPSANQVTMIWSKFWQPPRRPLETSWITYRHAGPRGPTAVCLQFRDAKRFFVWISKGIFLDFSSTGCCLKIN